MGQGTVKTLFSPDGQYCIEIFKRDDGFFGFVEMKHYKRAEGNFWALFGPHSTITDTAEAAEREARTTISWLIQIS
jgi:hypothetical protein